MAPIYPAFAMNRFGLGPRPGDLERISADPRAAIISELDAPDFALTDRVSLSSSPKIFLEIGPYRRDPIAATGSQRAGGTSLPQARAYMAEIAARIEQVRAVEIGFFERLVTFWTNHFTVAARANGYTQGLVGSYE